ncbi:MAG TPA: ABC-type transport auxiliary lipoprotein family protein, partial [Terriglobales bacterium]|nr:ABC-type transport auxiliary lipoprotein family protein [Terriglobales bacterium]
MTRRLTAILATLTISACLVGCGGTRFPAYYTLHVPPAVDVPIAGGTRSSLAVLEFRSPAYLHQGAIVYRTSPEQVGFYQYHRWAVDPREFLTNAMIDRLRA